MRIGLTGVDNTHADHAVRHLNVERALGAMRVVAIQGGTPPRTAQLADAGGIGTVVDRPEDMLGDVDGVIVMDRDGGVHRAHAEPFLRAGVPVFVDKPLATTMADAETILEAAQAGGAPVTSFSALRFAPAVDDLRTRLPEIGDLRSVCATGAVQRDSGYGGITFYGVHAVELALHLLPLPDTEPVVSVLPGAVLAHVRAGEAHAVVNLVERSAEAAVPFHIQVVGTTGVAAERVSLGKDYTLAGLRMFHEMVETSRQPFSRAELLAPVRILEAVTAAVGA